MAVVVVTGSSGLIGSEACRFFHDKGLDVVGIDNDMRSYYFGEEASTAWNTLRLKNELARFTHHAIDIRDSKAVNTLFSRLKHNIVLVLHAAAQPSHDWAVREPLTDFAVNATGTLVLLEATRQFSPNSAFVLTSTNKVYGDSPNLLPLRELDTRFEIDSTHPFYPHGIDESFSIDQSKHSIFGASKVAADILVQEYGRYFGLNTGIIRSGCVTGPAHAGVELHGFLAYLTKCIVTGCHYRVFGYRGKQVRDTIHASDFVSAVWHFFKNPKAGQVYNLGGSRRCHFSLVEAIALIEQTAKKSLDLEWVDTARPGDHLWWISDVRKFQKHYPDWSPKYTMSAILDELVRATEDRIGQKVGLPVYKGPKTESLENRL